MSVSSYMRSLLIGLTLGIAIISAAPGARAQSAADKATAREVATEGIELFRAGKYADALDRLRRAQALYDAPVHLLYIARSQEKLGQLVEASENYRLLDRYALPPNAPPAWVSAVDDGRKELQALEPRIPKLRILTEPGVRDPSLKMDGTPMSAAAIGIPRPINPGQHHIELAAAGFEPGAADVSIAESENKDVTVRPGARVAGQPTPQPGMERSQAAGPTAKPKEEPALFGFLVGLRLGPVVPTGQALHFTATGGLFGAQQISRDVNMTDIFQSGVEGELHLGLRIAQYFTPVLFGVSQELTPGSGVVDSQKISGTTSTAGGLGLIVGSSPHQFGGFGELDLLSESYSFTTTPVTQECKIKASGGGLRLGGGAFLPIVSFLNATAFTMITIGRFTSLDISGCPDFVLKSGDIPSDDQRTHSSVFVGIGGDFVFGADRVDD